jgi:hypothetical protein
MRYEHNRPQKTPHILRFQALKKLPELLQF